MLEIQKDIKKAPPQGGTKTQETLLISYESKKNCQVKTEKFPQKFSNLNYPNDLGHKKINFLDKLIANRDLLYTFFDTVFANLDGQIEVMLVNKREKDAIREKINRRQILQWWCEKTKGNWEFLTNWAFYYSPILRVNDNEYFVVTCFVLDVDNDNYSDQRFRAEIYRRINEAPVKPQIIVWSGKGAHLYFLFSPYIESEDRTLKPLYDKLCDIYCADRGASYSKRYMRSVPYSINPKYGKQVTFTLINDNRYTIEEIEERVEAYLGYRDYCDNNRTVNKNLLIEPSHASTEAWKKFFGMLKRDPNLRAIYNGKKTYKSGSEHDFALALALFVRGFTKGFVWQVLKSWRWGIANNSNKGALPEAEINRRLALIINSAENINPAYKLACIMSTTKFRSPESLARQAKLKINTVRQQLSRWRELGIVITKTKRVGKKRKKTFYKLSEFWLNSRNSKSKNKLRDISFSLTERVFERNKSVKRGGELGRGIPRFISSSLLEKIKDKNLEDLKADSVWCEIEARFDEYLKYRGLKVTDRGTAIKMWLFEQVKLYQLERGR